MRIDVQGWLGMMPDGRYHAEVHLVTRDNLRRRPDSLSGTPIVAPLFKVFARSKKPEDAISKAADAAASMLDTLASHPELQAMIPGVGTALAAVTEGAKMLGMDPKDAERYARKLGKKIGKRALKIAKKVGKQLIKDAAHAAEDVAKKVGGWLSRIF